MSPHGFARVRRVRRGYHRRQVDTFLGHVELALGGKLPLVTAAEVRQVGFELVHGGYDAAAVDRHLDALEERVLAAQALAAGRRGRVDLAGEAAVLREQLDGPYMKRFPRAPGLRMGYHPDDVDELVDRLLAQLSDAGLDAVAAQPALDDDDVRSAPFRPRRGGYREDAVDEAMDRVVEHLMLVRRQAGERTAERTVAETAAETVPETALPIRQPPHWAEPKIRKPVD